MFRKCSLENNGRKTMKTFTPENRRHLFLSILLLLLISACGSSEPQIIVEDAWVRPDPLMENAAGYLVIRNNGGESDFLVGVQAEFVGNATVHQTIMEGDIHKMEPVPRLEIPAGGVIELKPLSFHMMLMGLQSELEYGQTVQMVLEFEKSGLVDVDAEVRQE
jgi:copper(I)-binding protein